MDAGTRLVAFSGVQSATGHRSDIAAISGLAHNVGAVVFVDGTQLVGALPVGGDLQHVDVLAASDHKFLLNAGRGMGYCYLSLAAQRRFTPINAGWKAGAVPLTAIVTERDWRSRAPTNRAPIIRSHLAGAGRWWMHADYLFGGGRQFGLCA